MRASAEKFFDQIVYSSHNEDGRSELTALKLGRGDVVMAIAGSGARVIRRLLHSPGFGDGALTSRGTMKFTLEVFTEQF